MEDLKLFRFDCSVDVVANDYDEAVEKFDFKIEAGLFEARDFFVAEITEVK